MKPENDELTLNEDQKEAFEGFKEWLKGDDLFRVLAGYAGTGKTTLLDYFVSHAISEDNGLKKWGLSCVVTATTNKAVKVLKDKVDASTFMTIHSLLNIKPKKKGTKEIFEQVTYNQNDFSKYDLVIIDECSMISEKLLRIIENQLEPLGIKVLFVGDPAQLQPINEELSDCFDFPGWQLTDVVRHSDTISHTAKRVRSTSNHVPVNSLIAPPDIDWISLKDAKSMYYGWRDNPDSVRLLCWTNKRVLKWNQKLRQAAYENPPTDRFVEGDIIIANKPCFEGQENMIMMNSQEGEVTSVTEEYDSWRLKVKKFAGSWANLRVIKRDFQKQHDKDLQQFAAAKNWKEFWREKKKYHQIRHAYALTTHKSQGSTFENVIIDPKDIGKNKDTKERNQLFYVAMTRAANKVYILR